MGAPLRYTLLDVAGKTIGTFTSILVAGASMDAVTRVTKAPHYVVDEVTDTIVMKRGHLPEGTK